MNSSPIFLDYAATTPLAPEIGQLMSQLIAQPWANPASLHSAGRRALTQLEDAKDRIKSACLGPAGQTYQAWQAWQIIITSGGTEANNLALRALRGPDCPLIVGSTEHPSVLSPAQAAPDISPYATTLPVLPLTGQPNIDALQQYLAAQSSVAGRPSVQSPLVSLMLGNNETGILADIQAISEVCRRYGATLHTDVVQAFGKLDISAILPLVDAITISAHKLYGPVGVGALLVRTACHPQPMLYGGGQQLGIRPGTESVLLTSALAAACELAEARRLAGEPARLAGLRDSFEQQVRNLSPTSQIIGENCERLPHISCIGFPGRDRQALLMALDLAAIHCSSGSACASGSSQPSHVLTAMSLPQETVAGAIRFSFGAATTAHEVTEAAQRIANIFSKTK